MAEKQFLHASNWELVQIYFEGEISRHGFSAGENAEKLALAQNEVGELVLKVFLGEDKKGKNGNTLIGTLVSIARLDAWVGYGFFFSEVINI